MFYFAMQYIQTGRKCKSVRSIRDNAHWCCGFAVYETTQIVNGRWRTDINMQD